MCFELDVTGFLRQGENEIIIEFPWRAGHQKGCALRMVDGEGNCLVRTDRQVQWSPDGKNNWQPAVCTGPHGPENNAKEGRGALYLIRQ